VLKSASLVAVRIGIGVLFLAVALTFVDVSAWLRVVERTDLAWVLGAVASVSLYV
jgi:hypothetical protein